MCHPPPSSSPCPLCAPCSLSMQLREVMEGVLADPIAEGSDTSEDHEEAARALFGGEDSDSCDDDDDDDASGNAGAPRGSDGAALGGGGASGCSGGAVGADGQASPALLSPPAGPSAARECCSLQLPSPVQCVAC
jgi:hypothetical protein